MRKVFLAGTTLAFVFVMVDRAIALLNEPNDLAVGAGYFILLALVSAAASAWSWLRRRS